MDDRLQDPGNPDFRLFACAAWVYFTTRDKILPFFANAVHEAIENYVSIPYNHVAADEVSVTVGYVFFRHRLTGKGTGNRRLICAKEPAYIVAAKIVTPLLPLESSGFTTTG